jgi:hypothetical protein
VKLHLIAFAILFVLTGIFTNAVGQTTRRDSTRIPKAYWVGSGGGFSFLGDVEIMYNANAEIGNHWLITSLAQVEAKFFGSGNANIFTFGLQAGKVYKRGTGIFALSAGFAIMRVNDQKTAGVPVLIQAHTVILQTVGFGINLYANLNTISPSAGLNLTVALGRMATHN